MSAGFQDLIKFILDGEPVNASTTNRPTKALAGNISYLKDLLATIASGTALYARSKTIESGALVGMPVYWDSVSQTFKRAIGAADVDALTGALVTTPSSQVWGIIALKRSATLADILLFGNADLDMSSAIDGTITSGLYYLSNSAPGKLIAQEPPVGIAVCMVGQLNADDTVNVFVNTQLSDVLNEHKHYKFTLRAVPAGIVTPPLPDEPHTITSADSSVEGWLPADDPIFNGLAPAEAKFGYNLSQSKLSSLWPPIPVSGAYLEWIRGEDSSVLGVGVPPDFVVFDTNGIWWMNDCYGQVPWPTQLDTSGSEPASLSMSFSDFLDACAAPLHMQLYLYFTKPTFVSNNTAVLSLRAKDGSGLTVTCFPTGEARTTGNLEIDLDLGLLVEDQNNAGYQVIKTLDGNKFIRGPVASTIKGEGAAIVSGTPVGSGKFVGDITINVDQDISGSDIAVSIVRLESAREEHFQDILAIAFDSGREMAIRGQIIVPSKVELPAGTKGKLRFTLLGRAAGTVPSDLFTLTLRSLDQPSDLLTPAALPLTDSPVTLDVGVVLSAANQYYTAESDEFDVTTGAQLLFTLTRSASDSYAGELDLLTQRLILVTT